jgi:hypothetical protein
LCLCHNSITLGCAGHSEELQGRHARGGCGVHTQTRQTQSATTSLFNHLASILAHISIYQPHDNMHVCEASGVSLNSLFPEHKLAGHAITTVQSIPACQAQYGVSLRTGQVARHSKKIAACLIIMMVEASCTGCRQLWMATVSTHLTTSLTAHSSGIILRQPLGNIQNVVALDLEASLCTQQTNPHQC